MIELSPLFTDGAVLPMDREIRIFGDTDLTGVVTAVLETADRTVLSRGEVPVMQGHFLVRLPAIVEPHTNVRLIVSVDGQQAVAEDLCIGLVFIAGGQSNMELSLWNADNGPAEVAAHDDALLRWFQVSKESRLDRALAAWPHSRWHAMTPGSCADMSAVGYFFARKLRAELNVPVGVVGCYWGGTSVTAWIDEQGLRELTDGLAYMERWQANAGDTTLEQWQTAQDAFQEEMRVWNEAVARCKEANPGIVWAEIEQQCGVCPWHPPFGPGSPYRPGGLHETMFRRIVPMAATAMLYYQGESDATETQHYDQLLEQMILRWRTLLQNPALPFLNMQLPVYADGTPGSWARIRQAQQAVDDRLSHTGLACILDSGEENNIHPTNKLLPGLRLADVYLHMIGHASDDQMCPRIIRKQIKGHEMILETDLALATPDPEDEEARYFQIAGEDGIFHPAEARISGHSIVLASADCDYPVFARYAWINWGRVNVFGMNGRPLMPYSDEP